MSSYSELIKNFEKIRAYMRDFYVYGFKSREDYQKKSARSYPCRRLLAFCNLIRSSSTASVYLPCWISLLRK